MPLFPILLQANDKTTPPARAAVIAVAFVLLSSLFVGDVPADAFTGWFSPLP